MNATASVLMTTAELLALPDDGFDRELIRGELRERLMTKRNRRHSLILINVGYILKRWLSGQPEPPAGKSPSVRSSGRKHR